MLNETKYYCPECDEGIDFFPLVDEPQGGTRRDFMRKVGGGTVAMAVATGLKPAVAADAKQPAKPAESIIRELTASLSDEQRTQLVYPWDHKRSDGKPARLGTYNSAAFGKRLRDNYTAAQQELVRRALKAILSSDEAFERISRYDKWDGSRSFDGCGSVIFGNPDGGKFAWLFSGHHLTLRCDGNSEPGAAFGGPMYYGHSAGGYTERNVYLYQTKKVHEVFDALDEKQRQRAIADANPGDRERGIQRPKSDTPRPGIAYEELSADQKELVENVMRTLLEPFRKEDADEVMQIIKARGGLEKIHLAFYAHRDSKDRWQFWRLEGPGFIWNYRVLPHVHCYVNIASTV